MPDITVVIFTPADRYKYEVVPLSNELAGVATGTGGDFIENGDDKAAWLSWRINEGWTPHTPNNYGQASLSFDTSIRMMAASALNMYRQWKGNVTCRF